MWALPENKHVQQLYAVVVFPSYIIPIVCNLLYGQAIKDDTGTIRIQQPPRGPIYVSHTTIDQLIANLGKWARLFKFNGFSNRYIYTYKNL